MTDLSSSPPRATSQAGGMTMLKILLWIVGIIFLIGLLVVFGVFNLIF
jgi:hypothetical protein